MIPLYIWQYFFNSSLYLLLASTSLVKLGGSADRAPGGGALRKGFLFYNNAVCDYYYWTDMFYESITLLQLYDVWFIFIVFYWESSM